MLEAAINETLESGGNTYIFDYTETSDLGTRLLQRHKEQGVPYQLNRQTECSRQVRLIVTGSGQRPTNLNLV